MKGLLFLCVANSARSQMAEGLARRQFGRDVAVQSAGSRPSAVHPLAIRAMREIGIDISEHTSKSVETIEADTVDTVVTLCAEEVCPTFLRRSRRVHWPVADPATATGTEAERLQRFRDVRDDVARWMKSL